MRTYVRKPILGALSLFVFCTLSLFPLAPKANTHTHMNGLSRSLQPGTTYLIHHRRVHKAFVKGEIGGSIYPFCETRQQMEDILDHFLPGGGGKDVARAQLEEYLHPQNEFKEKVCYTLTKEQRARGGYWEFVIGNRVKVYNNVAFPVAPGVVTDTVYIIQIWKIDDSTSKPFYLMSTWDVENPGLQVKIEPSRIPS